jgi:hypothetical protein
MSLEYTIRGPTRELSGAWALRLLRQSSIDGDAAENRTSAYATFDEVDRYGWTALGLLGGQLAQAAMWSAVRTAV